MISLLYEFNLCDPYSTKAPIPDIPVNTHMLIFSDGLWHRHLSETRVAVCLILGPVFVLWRKASSTLPGHVPYCSQRMRAVSIAAAMIRRGNTTAKYRRKACSMWNLRRLD